MAQNEEEMSAQWTGGKFPTSDKSPFSDKYDIEGEQAALADVLAADEDLEPDHPMYGRYMMLIERQDILRRRENNETLRQHADPIIPDNVARGIATLGKLLPDSQETIELHTKEAYRIFIGRREGTNGYPVYSGVLAAKAIRDVVNSSTKGNPYADWVLICVERKIETLREEVQKRLVKFNQLIENEAKRGLKLSIIRSVEPAIVNIGFASAYGYLIADLILDYDVFVRLSKTLESRYRIDSNEAERDRRAFSRSIRSIFQYILTNRRNVGYSDRAGVPMSNLSRLDFLPNADLTAKKRIYAANKIYGGVLPREVLTGELVPKHHKNQYEFEPKVIEMLKVAPLEPEISELDTDFEVVQLAQQVVNKNDSGTKSE